MKKYILGVSAFYHDSAAVILENDKIIAAVQEERFTRKKQDSSFPKESIKYCLNQSGLTLNDLDAIVFYDKPFLKFERILETYNVHAPKGLKSFINSMPIWIKEKLFLKKLIKKNLREIEEINFNNVKLLFSEHHLSHSGSAFFPSPFEEAAILTIDGVGEWATVSISHGNKNKISLLKELKFPHSVGLLYSAFTYYLGFKVNSGEYKLMGLSSYGTPNSERVNFFKEKIKKDLIDLKEDGSIWLNQTYFDYSVGLKMTVDSKWKELFDLPRRIPESELKAQHCDLAMAIQQVTEEIVLKLAKYAKKITKSSNLCLAGGVALNCVANGKIIKEKIFENVWIQPAAGDAGGALGAAFSILHIYFDKERKAIIFMTKWKVHIWGLNFLILILKIWLKNMEQSLKNIRKLQICVKQ
jgi:carbamoyltransferase